MTPCVFNLNYLRFYLAKYQKQGQFWNAQNKQISKLTLLIEFGQVEAEILPKTNCQVFLWTRCITEKKETFLRFQNKQ